MKTTRQIRLANIRNSFDIREILYRSGVYFNIFFAQHSSFICAAQREDSWRVDRERNLACKRNKFLSILDISARSSVESSKGVLLDKDKVQEVNLYIYICTHVSFVLSDIHAFRGSFSQEKVLLFSRHAFWVDDGTNRDGISI